MLYYINLKFLPTFQGTFCRDRLYFPLPEETYTSKLLFEIYTKNSSFFTIYGINSLDKNNWCWYMRSKGISRILACKKFHNFNSF